MITLPDPQLHLLTSVASLLLSDLYLLDQLRRETITEMASASGRIISSHANLQLESMAVEVNE